MLRLPAAEKSTSVHSDGVGFGISAPFSQALCVCCLGLFCSDSGLATPFFRGVTSSAVGPAPGTLFRLCPVGCAVGLCAGPLQVPDWPPGNDIPERFLPRAAPEDE